MYTVCCPAQRHFLISSHGSNTGRKPSSAHRTLAAFQETPCLHGQHPTVRPHLCSRLPQTPRQGLNHFNNISISLQQSIKQIFVPVICHRAVFSSDSQDPLDVCIFSIPPTTKTNPVNLVNQATWPRVPQTTRRPSTILLTGEYVWLASVRSEFPGRGYDDSLI